MMAPSPVNEKHGVHDDHTSKPGLRQRTRRICARFWWLFLFIFIVVVIIIVLPIVYVAYPKVARSSASESTLNVTAMSIENPKANSVTLSFDQTLYTSSKYHPTLYPFNASFYLLGSQTPFASIQTPQIQAVNGTTSTVLPQQVNITHIDEFTKYVLLALASEEFTIALRGKGDLKQGILPKTTVGYDKNITMKGFNKLSSFTLQSFHVINGTEPDGTNALGTALISNPTVMTISLGNVTLAMSVDGTPIGTAILPNLTLKPGDNTVPMRAEVYQLVVVGIVLKSYQQGILPVDVTGNTSTYDGAQLPYYNAMLGATKLRLDLNVFDALKGSNLTARSVRMLQ